MAGPMGVEIHTVPMGPLCAGGDSWVPMGKEIHFGHTPLPLHLIGGIGRKASKSQFPMH